MSVILSKIDAKITYNDNKEGISPSLGIVPLKQFA
jgi:hypothetical protein